MTPIGLIDPPAIHSSGCLRLDNAHTAIATERGAQGPTLAGRERHWPVFLLLKCTDRQPAPDSIPNACRRRLGGDGKACLSACGRGCPDCPIHVKKSACPVASDRIFLFFFLLCLRAWLTEGAIQSLQSRLPLTGLSVLNNPRQRRKEELFSKSSCQWTAPFDETDGH